MRSKKKPRACGGCSSTESTSWHRQRGNNKFFCDGCQAKKLRSKQQSLSPTQSGNDCYPKDAAASPSTDSRDAAANNPEGQCAKMDASDSFASRSIAGSTKEESVESDGDKEITEPASNAESKSEEPTVEPSPSSAKRDEEPEDCKVEKKHKSPIIQPRLTRSRFSNRPIRASVLAAANRIHSETERQSHSRSSSATGNGVYAKSQGSNVSLAGASSSLVVPRNKSRRHIFKLAKPEKTQSKRASMSTHPTLWHKGKLFRQNDVVGLVDESDGNTYYAMIRGLLRDQYCQQFACVNWLVPTTASPRDRRFEASTYALGPEDETFYSMDSLEFICHIQPEYFTSRRATVSSLFSVRAQSIDHSLNPQSQFVGIL